MRTVPQCTLHSEGDHTLRLAEAGERFVITVHGRSVAELGPYERRWVPAESVRTLLVTPTDPGVLDDLRRMEPEEVTDPWRG